MLRKAILLIAAIPFMGALWLLTLIGQFLSMGRTLVVSAIAYTIAVILPITLSLTVCARDLTRGCHRPTWARID